MPIARYAGCQYENFVFPSNMEAINSASGHWWKIEGLKPVTIGTLLFIFMMKIAVFEESIW